MALKKIDLNKAHVLIADSDRMISDVLKETLRRMGLENVTVVRHGRAAIDVIRQREVDILITEWEMTPLDGISLIKTLRQSEDARYALLPVIMLTARAQMPDVIEARDKGVTEFLVKPFTAKTLYNRLEHVIEFPRDFLITEQYVGPDRRRIRKTIKEDDRRVIVPIAQPEPKKIPAAAKNQPRRIVPSYAIKKKIGLISSLDEMITEDVLNSAQEAIAAFQEESLQWIAADLQELEQAVAAVKAGGYAEAAELAKAALLAMKSHAGTFGYLLASEVAFDFYGFLRNHYEHGNPNHTVILQKHMDVLKIILARKVRGSGAEMERELAEGLKILTCKLQES